MGNIKFNYHISCKKYKYNKTERKDRSRRCKSKKERWNIWNSGLGKQTRNTRIFKYRKKRWNYSRRN